MGIIEMKDDRELTEFDDGGIIVDSENSRYYSLNQSGAIILNTLMKYDTLTEAIQACQNIIDASENELEVAISEFIVDLKKSDVIW